MNAIRAGISAWNAREHVPRSEWGYNEYHARLNRYWVNQAYYDNTVYDAIEAFSPTLKASERLYRHVRGVYNPVFRENKLITSFAYRGTLDTDNLGDGALPLLYDNAALDEPLRQVMRWSNLGQQLAMYPHYAALLGDVAWWVVDDRVRQRVRLELLHPGKIRDVELDEVGNVKAAVIEYEREEQPDVARVVPGRYGMKRLTKPTDSYTFSLRVTREKFETFKNGEPFPFYQDFDGEPIAEWSNDYGFVPLKLAYFEPTEDGWGKSSFYATRRKIDELNDQASLLHDSIRNTVVPLLKARGVTKTATLEASKDERTGLNILYLPDKDSDIDALSIPLSIADASANIREILGELERDMPVLALQRIREQGAMTAPGVRSGYSDAIGRIEDARKNLDPAIAMALQMAVSVGAIMGYEGFTGFNAESYDRGDMMLSVKERPVISDTLAKSEKLQMLVTVSGQPPEVARLMLRELDYTEEDIDRVVGSIETGSQQRAGQSVDDADVGAANDTLVRLGIADLLNGDTADGSEPADGTAPTGV